MKRKSLLFMLLFALMAPWAANAQSVQIGDGTGTNNYLPSTSTWNYSVTQQIYTAEEIDASGNITSIAFYNAGTEKARKYNIYMAHTTKSAFESTTDWIALTDANLVYQGAEAVALVANTWTTFTLDTPFAYNGTDNLVIGVLDLTGSWSSGLSCRAFTAANQALYKYQDGGAYGIDGTYNGTVQTATMGSTKNQIVLGGIQQARPAPTGLTATPHPTTADLSWTENGTATQWEVAYKTSAEEEFTTVVVNTNPYTLTGLTGETAYNVKVRAYYSETAQSQWSAVVNFTTQPACPAPTALASSNLTTNSATLTWTAGYEESDWVLQYGTTYGFTEGTYTEVTVNGTPTYEVTGLSEFTTYYARVKADCGGESQSVWSSMHTFTTKEICPDGKICIGEGTATNSYLPTYNYYNYSLTEQIYTAEEIGQAGAILSVDIFSVGTVTRTLEFYMVSTEKETFTGGSDWIVATASDLVYSGSVTFAANSWNTIEFDNPFIYDGRSNVALIVRDMSGTYVTSINFYVFDAPSQAIRIYQDSAPYDLANPGSGTVMNVKNRIRLAIGEPPACPKPTNLTVEPSWTSANLSWQGTSNSYAVQYRTAGYSQPAEGSFYDDFEDGIDQWTLLVNGEGDGFIRVNGATYFGDDYAAHSGDYAVLCRSYGDSGALNADNWMISPQLTIPSTMSFWAMGSVNYPETYSVCVSTTGTETSNFTVVQTYTENPGEWTQIMVDLSSYAGQTGYVAFHHEAEDADYLFIDDVLIGSEETVPAGAWIQRSTTETSIELTGLTIDTEYEYQVKGFCDDSEESEWTAILTFTTLNDKDKHFVTAGAWNVAGNWMPEGVPTDNCFVTIKAAATIPSGCDAVAKEITIDGGSITIQDGGQLHSGNNVTATVEKNINGYTGAKDNYYLIASPLTTSTTISNVQNLQSGTFDFYTFDGTQELEWINQNPAYNTSAITTMGLGKGYLYANAANLTTLSFTGTVRAQLSNFTYNGSTITYDATADPAEGNYTNWNLVGNFLPHNGYPYVGTLSNGYVVYADEQNFYTMGDGELIVAVDEYVKPAEGIFVEATGASQYVFWSSESHTAKSASMSMNVSYQGTLVDRALLRFGEGKGLGKFQMNPNHTKIYMPVEGKDYAVVYTEAQGEMPVSFKAEENGTYTLSFNTENVELSYLHLIDNMTGIETDLLANPSYSFEASTTDYANRFKLVFATGDNNSEDFAFFSNGSFVINNEGIATVQVIDVNGRIISSESINGCANVNVKAAAGVYMIRLVNGSNVKVQKVVVK